MVRFFKVARYSPAMRSLLDVLYRERRALFGCAAMTAGATLVLAAMMHLAEGKVQPDKLGTIPEAMWRAIVTLGTIGYGDVIPVTTLRQVDRHGGDLCRRDPDRATGRHHRYRVLGADPPVAILS